MYLHVLTNALKLVTVTSLLCPFSLLIEKPIVINGSLGARVQISGYHTGRSKIDYGHGNGIIRREKIKQ